MAVTAPHGSSRGLTKDWLIPLWALFLLLVPWPVFAQPAGPWGPVNEACTTSGTQVSGAASVVKATIEAGTPGTTFLVRAGTYTFAAGAPLLTIPARVTVKPYNCEAVTFQGTSVANPNDPAHPGYYGSMFAVASGTSSQPTTLAGITVQGTWTGGIGQGNCGTLVHEKIVDLSNKSWVTLRNNNLYGGANDAIIIDNGGGNLLIQGNDLNSGPAKPGGCGLPGSTGGHVIYFGLNGAAPDGVQILNNKIRGAYFGDVMTGDDAIAMSKGNNVLIEGNYFTDQYNLEDVMDIKSQNSTTPVIFRKNWLDGPTIARGTKGGQDSGTSAICLQMGDNATSSLATLQHVIERNVFDRCPKSAVTLGAGQRYSRGLFRNNLFLHGTADPPSTDNAGRVFVDKGLDTTWVNNVFFHTYVRLASSNGCGPSGTVMRNNIFYHARIEDNTPACATDKAYTATHNQVFSSVGGSGWDTNTSSNTAATVNNNLSTDPVFVDAAGTGVTDRNFNLQLTSPALNSGIAVAGITLASIGTINRGMFEQPTMGACNTVDNNSDTCTVNAIHTPITVTCGSLTPEVAGANRTASACAVTSSTFTYDVSGAVRTGPPTILTLNVAYAGIEDNALIGNSLRGQMSTVTDQPVTNTIGAPATHVVTEAHCRCAFPHTVETVTRWHAGEDQACEVFPTGTVAVVCQLRCSVADCPAQGYSWWASDNGGAAYEVGDAFGANRLAYAKDLVLQDGDLTTRQLTSCTHVAGTVYTTPRQAVFPAIPIPNGQCSEFRGVFQVLDTATVGQPITVGLQKDSGGGVTQTVVQTLSVTGAKGRF